jgi:hypothetical protein
VEIIYTVPSLFAVAGFRVHIPVIVLMTAF